MHCTVHTARCTRGGSASPASDEELHPRKATTTTVTTTTSTVPARGKITHDMAYNISAQGKQKRTLRELHGGEGGGGRPRRPEWKPADPHCTAYFLSDRSKTKSEHQDTKNMIQMKHAQKYVADRGPTRSEQPQKHNKTYHKQNI